MNVLPLVGANLVKRTKEAFRALANLKELSQRENYFTGGHRACAGCGFPILVRLVMTVAPQPVVICAATGCLEVTSTIYPQTAWRTSFIHSAFPNAAATLSGVETAYRSLERQGKLEGGFTFIAFGGDGGTYDIGLQSLSGAMERGHRMLYICYDNGGYANTGIQRSSATPRRASTTTSPAGRVIPGKPQPRKDLTAIMAAHNIPYVAQTAISHHNDLLTKVEKALSKDGPAFLNVMAPCRLIWATPPEETVDVTWHAVECNFWPLFEVDEGEWRLTYRPRVEKSFREWLGRQGRFKHLFKGDHEDILRDLEDEVATNWAHLKERCKEEG